MKNENFQLLKEKNGRKISQVQNMKIIIFQQYISYSIYIILYKKLKMIILNKKLLNR